MLLLFLITVKVPPKPKQAGNLKQKQIRRWADRIFEMDDSSWKKQEDLLFAFISIAKSNHGEGPLTKWA